MDKDLIDFVEKLPSYPKKIYDMTDEDKLKYEYKGDVNDISNRLKTKLFNVWNLWHEIDKNEEIVKLLKYDEKYKNIKYKNSDEYKAKCLCIQMLDSLSKILTSTDLLEELFLPNDTRQP